MASIAPSVALRLANVAAEIRLKPSPDAADLAFTARELVLTTLPHRDPGNVPAWQRVNGWFTMTIHPMIDSKGRARYPYGSIPRLLLYWIVTEAKRTESRRLDLGPSLADFMRQLELNPATGGGKRGDARRLQDQMERLFRAQVSFEEALPLPTAARRWLTMPISETGELWWSPAVPAQRALFGSYVVLGEAFYRAITAKAFPVDRRALKALKRSPLALDLYAWLAYRVFGLKGRTQFISWNGLCGQIGSAYSDPANFRKAAQVALKKVAVVYPGLAYRCRPGGFTLLPGLPAVPPATAGKAPFIHGEKVPPPNARGCGDGRTYPPKRTVKRYP